MNSSPSSPHSAPASWRYVAAGFACLLVSSYVDNIRGPLLPVMARELSLDHRSLGLALAASYVAAGVAVSYLVHALNRWSERSVLLVTALAGIIVGLGATRVSGFASLFVLSCFTGAVISVLGTMSNVLVLEGTPSAWQGKVLAGLHAMFGLGSLAGAALVAARLAAGDRWSNLYTIAVPCFLGLLAFAAIGMKRAAKERPRTVQAATLAPAHMALVGLFGLYVVGEVMTSLWLSSFLVEAEGFSPEDAARFQARYFLVLTAARIACVVLVKQRWERLVLTLALVLPIGAFAIGRMGAPSALVFMGLYGPFFPVMLARASRLYADRWRTITIWTIVAMNGLLAVSTAGLGALADAYGIVRAFHLPPLVLAMTLAGLWLYFRRLERPISSP